MANGKNCSSNVKKHSGFSASNVDAINEGLGLVHCTRAMGRKRIVVSKCMEKVSPTLHCRTPLKRRQVMRTNRGSNKSLLEALPEDILIRVLCFVDHDDLKQLIQVSKSFRDATLVANQNHFAYSTPRAKRITGLSSDLELDSPEAPNAPRRQKCSRSGISGKTLSDLSVALFHSPEDERWSRNILREREI
ncbi:hypothetical protein NE237_000481 [Protea cynaroides]|uniref:F-box domain-containing protein n=1 Tax=Protea cynaroides TaxID=273540 RepID=A0A9Q0QXI7_9MAGN|nr:hypothetical protein NE237_000481 [Protea cynaroides]